MVRLLLNLGAKNGAPGEWKPKLEGLRIALRDAVSDLSEADGVRLMRQPERCSVVVGGVFPR